MKVIRDNELFGLMMIPLFVDYGIKRCNIKSCRARPNTLITETSDEVPVYALCEEHFQAGNQGIPIDIELEFDDFDAFAADRAAQEEAASLDAANLELSNQQANG